MKKVAVYSIARNEVHEVADWEQTTREADYRLVFDTGSTDGTDTELERFPDVVVHRGTISPWRFDDARNAALALIPADIDICVSLDMDERLRGVDCESGVGWKQAILSEWEDDTKMLRPPMASGGAYYHSYRIHTRFGWRWKSPVHEILHYRGAEPYVEKLIDSLVIDHLPKNDKPRPAQRALLEEAVKETPHDARMALQYGWQLLIDGNVPEGIVEMQRFLALNSETGIDAAFVHRTIAKHDHEDRFVEHMKRADAAHPDISNSIALAEFFNRKERWQECYTAAQAGIARQRMWPRTTASGHWGDDSRLTTSYLHDMASRSAFMTWDFEAAYGHAVEAYRRAPDDDHRENLKRIQERIAEGATLENIPRRKTPSVLTIEVVKAPEPAEEHAVVYQLDIANRNRDVADDNAAVANS